MGVAPANLYAPVTTTSPVKAVLPDFLIQLLHWVCMLDGTPLSLPIAVAEAPQNL